MAHVGRRRGPRREGDHLGRTCEGALMRRCDWILPKTSPFLSLILLFCDWASWEGDVGPACAVVGPSRGRRSSARRLTRGVGFASRGCSLVRSSLPGAPRRLILTYKTCKINQFLSIIVIFVFFFFYVILRKKKPAYVLYHACLALLQ